MDSLQYLDLSANSLTGTVPKLSARLKSPLKVFKLSQNLINGTLDELASTPNLRIGNLILSYNRISGTLPGKIVASFGATHLHISHNRLSGTVPSPIPPQASFLVLSGNNFEGPLPEMDVAAGPHRLLQLDLSDNYFNGTIPQSYTMLADLQYMSLRSNRLEGTVPVEISRLVNMLSFDLSSNSFTGTLPSLNKNVNLSRLAVARNEFHGPIPELNGDKLQLADFGHNHFDDYSQLLEVMNTSKTLTHMDISENQFSGNVDPRLFQSAHMLAFSCASNGFTGTLPPVSLPQLITLDISDNNFTGSLPTHLCTEHLITLDLSDNDFYGELAFGIAGGVRPSCPNLAMLRVHGNRLSGSVDKLFFPLITYWDLSNNLFSFDVNALSKFSTAVTIDASQNRISGSLTLTGLSSLQAIDLSDNALDDIIDLNSIGTLFQNGSLRFVSVLNNPKIPTVESISNSRLTQTLQKVPSVEHRNVDCFTLSFISLSIFAFNESLFNWNQCVCSDGYFGIPPIHCYPCHEGSTCTGETLQLKADSYLFTPSHQPISIVSPLYTESCIEGSEYPESNCNGTTLSTNRDKFSFVSFDQCTYGSRGRICSECICEPSSNNGECFYEQGALCKRCHRVYSSSFTVPIAVFLYFTILISLTPLMYLIIKSRRTPQKKEWSKLSLTKRVIYRILHGARLGHVPILIGFIQICAELTLWEVYAFRAWTRLLNGETETVGIRCFFTFLTRPMARLLTRLFLPVAVLVLVLSSIILAEALYRLLKTLRNGRRTHRIADTAPQQAPLRHSLASTDEESDSESLEAANTPLLDHTDSSQAMHTVSSTDDHGVEYFALNSVSSTLLHDTRDIEQELRYPISAFLSSTAIMIVQFFYFGSALTATEYFFHNIQPNTNLKYVQAHPWMVYSDAASLRLVSTPFLIIFVFGIPCSFCLLAWRVRHKVSSPELEQYLGKLFSHYRIRYFWWELVNVVRKLAIALFLRGISPASAFQSGSVILCIGIVQSLQTTFRPWKTRLENIMDPIAGFLLIATTFASRITIFVHSKALLYTTLSLDLCFVLACIGFIIYHTCTDTTDYERMWNLKRCEKDGTKALESFAEPLLNEPINILHES
jgi:hypothetical protein